MLTVKKFMLPVKKFMLTVKKFLLTVQGCGDQDAAGQAVAGRDAELPTCGQQGAHGLSLARYSHETSYQASKATVSR